VKATKDEGREEGKKKRRSAFSRRGFLQGFGAGTGVLATGVLAPEQAEAAPATAVQGPDEVAITLTINGKPQNVKVEPRATLCDTLRHALDVTGAKRVCDRGTCGACTVIMDKKVVYGCTVLAIDAAGKKIETIEGLAVAPRLHPVSKAFWDHDAQQCGYCTPGFVMAAKGFLDRNPNPTLEQVKKGLGGNLCRCGTYVGIRKAVLQAAKEMQGGRNA
jgi:xanthine dehydrogenase YagT iron-sulfur-binding subunit